MASYRLTAVSILITMLLSAAESDQANATSNLRGAVNLRCVQQHDICGSNGRVTASCCGKMDCLESSNGLMRCGASATLQASYAQYFDKNAYYPFGATNIDDDVTAPAGLTSQQCEDRCTSDPSCMCVTQERSTGKCWKRANCVANQWKAQTGYNVYLKNPAPTPTPAPTPPPSGAYAQYFDKNAYSPFGAANIDDDSTAPVGLSSQHCEQRCSADPNCMCVTQERATGKCWKRANCVPGQWKSQQGYNVYLKSSAPTPMPSPPSPPPHSGMSLRWDFESSYCMSVDNNRFQNGQRLQLWKCASGIGQSFQFADQTWSGSLLKVTADPNYCVVIDGNKDTNKAAMQLWQCDQTATAQRWVKRSVRGDAFLLSNGAYPNKCLVVDGNKGSNGQRLQLWDCNGYEQHKTWSSGVVV